MNTGIGMERVKFLVGLACCLQWQNCHMGQLTYGTCIRKLPSIKHLPAPQSIFEILIFSVFMELLFCPIPWKFSDVSILFSRGVDIE